MKKSAVVGLTALALAGALTISAGIGSAVNGKWFKNPDVTTWFDSWGKEDIKPVEANGGAVIGDGESHGIRLMSAMVPEEQYEDYGISPLAENVYSLSVTYTPAETTFKKTDFAVSFKNPSSTWATGKKVADYVKVTSTGDTTATLQVLQPFSEQIIVTASNNRHPTIKSTSTVDYVCGGASFNIDSYCDVQDDINLNITNWKYGTVEPEINVTFIHEIDGYDQIKAAGYNVQKYYTYDFTGYQTLADINGEGFRTLKLMYHDVVSDYSSLSSAQKQEYDRLLGTLFSEYSDGEGCGRWAVKYTRVYNGVDYGGVDPMTDLNNDLYWNDYDKGLNFAEGFEVIPTKATSNTTSIIAG